MSRHSNEGRFTATAMCRLTPFFGWQVSLASDFMWNWNAKEATASIGYDYILRQCRLRGRVDSEGKVAPQLPPHILKQNKSNKCSLLYGITRFLHMCPVRAAS
jgi:hypothetical protein